jgi:hypothetical protein
MNVVYEHIETAKRNYLGVTFSLEECRDQLQNAVRDNLQDREEWQDSIDRLRALGNETGFEASEGLLADIQALEREKIAVQQFRVGEAFAEVILE